MERRPLLGRLADDTAVRVGEVDASGRPLAVRSPGAAWIPKIAVSSRMARPLNRRPSAFSTAPRHVTEPVMMW